MGHNPARLEIQKTRLLYMQYILQQSEDSTILKFVNLQLEQSTCGGDWEATCMQDLKDLYIEESLSEITFMSKNKFSKLLRERSQIKALDYSIGKQIVKGKDIK